MPSSPPPGDGSPDDPVIPLRPRRRPSPVPVLVTLIAALLVAGSAVAVNRSGAPTVAAGFTVPAPADLPVEQASAPAPTTTTTATTVPPPPPPPPPPPAAAPRTKPAPPPPARAPTPIVKVGEIRIPKIGLVHAIYEGVTLTVIDRGPGHWPGSAMPGQLGNAVIAGHRVTHSRPFRNIDQLVPGDEIFFKTDQGEFRYVMTKQEIVNPRDTWIVNPTPDATLTLFACHPPGSARQRIVVRGVYAPGPATA